MLIDASVSTFIPYRYFHAATVLTVQGLKDLVVGEEQVLFQASNALSQCVKRTTSSGAPFIGSAEAVECHRLLLIASMIVDFAINDYILFLF